MVFSPAALLIAAGLLSACVNSPTSVLNLKPEPLPQSPEQVNKSGTFPAIGQTPKAQTSQLTQAERAKIEADLKPATERNGVEAARQAQTQYDRDVAEMKKLLEYQEKKRRSQNF